MEREPVRDDVEAYRRHFDEVRRRHPRVDVSRVDALVAVRLRATGHTRSEVEQAIREGAPKDRAQETRDWAEYARRAAAHAFGISGERALQRMDKAGDRLLTLEGRGPSREEPELMPPGGPFGGWLGR